MVVMHMYIIGASHDPVIDQMINAVGTRAFPSSLAAENSPNLLLSQFYQGLARV